MASEENSGLEFDTTPLPGAKADDPGKGAADSDKSDKEVAEDLAEDPEVDSGDGADPESTRDDSAQAAEDSVGDVAFSPFHGNRVWSRDGDLPAE